MFLSAWLLYLQYKLSRAATPFKHIKKNGNHPGYHERNPGTVTCHQLLVKEGNGYINRNEARFNFSRLCRKKENHRIFDKFRAIDFCYGLITFFVNLL